MNLENLEKIFDHTLLKSDACLKNIIILCEEAMKFNFRSICINPIWLSEANSIINQTNINICSVVGFPLGTNPTSIKLAELDYSIKNGANEIDFVMNIGLFKDKKFNYVEKEIKSIVNESNGHKVKVIIEAGVLSLKEIAIATKLAENSGVDFIKTSTGFSSFGASTKIISIIKKNLNSKIKIKASGGINNLEQVKKLLTAGVDIIGSSSSAIIMKELARN